MTDNRQEISGASRPKALVLPWAVTLVIAAFSLLPAPAQQPVAGTMARPAASIDAADPTRSVTEFDVNGLKVLVKRREKSQSVAAGVFFKGGARNVTAENAGVEALMLDAASESSQNYPLEKMRRELSMMGTVIGYGINLDYSVLSLASTRRYFDHSWEIFADTLLHPSFTQSDFVRVKNRSLASLSNDEDTPDSYLQVLQAQSAYAGHPYLNDPRGSVSSVSRLTVEDVRRFHQKMMQTSRMLLVIVGDVDPQDIRAKVEAAFGKLPRGDYSSSAVPALSFTTPAVAVTAKELPTNYVQGVYVAPALDSPDIFPMRVASSILQNRVYTEVRVRRNLSYAPDAFLWSNGANLGGLYVTAVDANQAIGVMLNEVRRLQTEDIESSDVRDTAQQFLTKYYLGQETNAAQAGELAQYELLGGGWKTSAQFLDRIRAVTPADVRRVANKYMRNMRFVVIGDPAAIDRNVFAGK